MMVLSEEVLRYIAKQPSPQKEVCERLRSIILATLPDIKERMRYGVPYFGDEFYIVALKDHVNLGFAISNLSIKEQSELKQGGKTARVLKFHSVPDIDGPKVMNLLRLVWDRKGTKQK